MRPPTVWHPFHTWMASVIGKHMFVLMYNYEHWASLLPPSWWKGLRGAYDWLWCNRKTKRASSPRWLHSIFLSFYLYSVNTRRCLSGTGVTKSSSASVSPPHRSGETGGEAGNLLNIQEMRSYRLRTERMVVRRSSSNKKPTQRKKEQRGKPERLANLRVKWDGNEKREGEIGKWGGATAFRKGEFEG